MTHKPTRRKGIDNRVKYEIDLGLALLAMRTPRGVSVGLNEIAAWCGCSHTRIRQIEQQALRKLKVKASELRREI